MLINNREFDIKVTNHEVRNENEHHFHFELLPTSPFAGNRLYNLIVTKKDKHLKLDKVIHGSEKQCNFCNRGYSCPSLTKRKREIFQEVYPQLEDFKNAVVTADIEE